MRFITKPIAWVLIACLVNNPIAGFYWVTGLIFFTPFPAVADEFLNKAAEGQVLGTDLMTGYNPPSVNAAGQVTLNNGLVAGQTVQQNELFQEIQPGSMDAAVASYGNAGSMGTYVNNTLSNLSTGGSTHAYAFQTLMGSNTAKPNISNDPIWQTSDDVLGQESSDINDLFNGCQKKTTFNEKSCSTHVEDLKTCKKTSKTEKCTVTRVVSNSPVMGFRAGDGNISSCGEGCTYLNVGVVGNNYWSSDCDVFTWEASFTVSNVDLITKVTIDRLDYDDKTRILINDDLIYTGSTGWDGGCELDDSWHEDPDIDITGAFKNAAVAGNGIVTVRQETKVGTLGEGYSRLKVIETPLTEQFIDTPAGCRDRLFDAWPIDGTPPGFVSTGSLNDEASTDWWACTDASTSRVVGAVTITPQDHAGLLSDILPDAPATPPAAICYKAETRIPGHINLDCFTDLDGYQVCPEYDYNAAAHDSCETLQSNASCAYAGEQCADGAINPITGSCQEFIVTYDCGKNYPASCGQVNDSEKTICDSSIRCMGGECVDQQNESNKDFIKAAAALQTLNQVQQNNECDPYAGGCTLFAGEPMECQMADLSILGQVDCCNMPIEGSWIDYMLLATNTWELADTSVQAYSIAHNGALLTNSVGAWNMVSANTVLQAPVSAITETWTSITEPFTSMYDSVASMLGEEIGTNLGIEAIKQQVVQWMGEWVASTFGEAAASTLLTATTTGAGTAVTTTYSMAGSMLSSIITVVGIVYAIYQIAKMVVQLIFACTEDEVKLNMLKQQRLCTSSGEIGTYCSAEVLGMCVARKEAYCCFSSPFARIFQQQARPQLGMTFGNPESPTCEGLSINNISQLDFDEMDFSEWITMMKISNQLPGDGLIADSLYDKANITKGKLPNTKNDNAQDRLDTQTTGSDIDAIRQHLLDNL